MEFKIEDIPVKRDGYKGKYDSYFGSMKVGQSFVVPLEMRVKITNAAVYYGKRNNMKFSIRMTDGVLRCGRIA